MGDRKGLTKLDRTNGFDDGLDYMRVKKSKLAQQNDQIRETLRNRNNSSKTDIFKGISINVNGRTQPTADELKRLVLLNGGDYHPYYRYQTTKFMIATNLSSARMKTLRPDDRVVRPEWITDSIESKCLLPYEDYQLFADEMRGKTGSVLGLNDDSLMLTDGSSSTNGLVSVSDSYKQNYRNPKSKQTAPLTKNRDIREMFSKTVRSLDRGQGKESSKLSSQSSEGSRIRDRILQGSSAQLCDHDDSSNSRETNNEQHSTNKKSDPASDLVNNNRPMDDKNWFPISNASRTRYSANICGLTGLDDVIGLITGWVGCSQGFKDEDAKCVTQYFHDLMNENEYHNKFYEIIDALQQKVLQQNESCWIDFYNELVQTLKKQLTHNREVAQDLYQLISPIDVPEDSRESSNCVENVEKTTNRPSLHPVVEVDID